jgi:hypothetical protein
MSGPGQLTFRVIALCAILVGAIVATALSHDVWVLALAVAGLLAAALAVGLSVNAMLGNDDRTDAEDPYRGPVALLGAIATLTVVLAIALPVETSSAVSTRASDAQSAAATVRAFLATAVLDDNTYLSCQYLAPSAQQAVANLAGGDQTCRDALTATQPSFDGVHSEGSLHALHLRAMVRDGTAFVTVERTGRSPATFELRPATAAELAAYEAPQAAWRIVSGATIVLAG